MAFSLYDATVPSYRQILSAVAELVRKAEAFCAEQGIASATIIQARLAEDMLPFAYQVKSCAVHSLGAIEGVRKGLFSPDTTPPPEAFEALGAQIAEADAALAAIEPAEIESFIGRGMRFEMGSFTRSFSAENFLLSFSQPNFYFHAVTAYDILRWKGVAIGKRHFLGSLRIRD